MSETYKCRFCDTRIVGYHAVCDECKEELGEDIYATDLSGDLPTVEVIAALTAERDELKRKVEAVDKWGIAYFGNAEHFWKHIEHTPTVEEIEASGVMMLQFYGPKLGEEFNEDNASD